MIKNLYFYKIYDMSSNSLDRENLTSKLATPLQAANALAVRTLITNYSEMSSQHATIRSGEVRQS